MNDSDDDYFSDDLVLDDKTLAVLEEEESKFKRITNTQAEQAVGPPPKRQRTTASWQPQSALQRADTLRDVDDLPDVSIRQDGTYALLDNQRYLSGPSSRFGSVVAQTGSGTRPATAASLSQSSATPMRSASVAAPVRATQAPRPSSAARGTRVVQSPASSQGISRTQSGPPRRVPSATVSGEYIQQLLRQIEELRNENEAIQANMVSVLEVKFAREGEVTILRKRLEKTAQEHLTQVAELKAAKDEADAKQIVLRKQYETEKEQLRTELTFRRLELETCLRKQPAALPTKDHTSQPTEPLSLQQPRSGQWGAAVSSRIAPETPRHPRFGVISDFEKPKQVTSPETKHLPSGFQTGPLRSQCTNVRKGRETTLFPTASPIVSGGSPLPQGSSSLFPQHDIFGTQKDDGGHVEDFILPIDGGADDVRMVDEGTPFMTLSSEENTAVLTHPSRNLLHDVMLTHTLQGSKLPTLQLLMCVSPADTSQVQSYSAVLMRILDTLGGILTHPDEDFNDLAQIICCALSRVTELLAKSNLISPLTAVLNLLTNLAYVLPSIHELLLSQYAPGHNEAPQLLEVLDNIIQGQLRELDVTIGNESPELCSLGKETLALYEALVWWIPDDLEDRLSACPSISSLLTTLLHPRRPMWFLIKSMQVLLWLSTRRNLFRSLLSPPASERAGSNSGLVDLVHYPQINLVCSLLTNTDRQGAEADGLKIRIIMFFGMLSSAHPDAYTILIESQELIPSIVLYLCHLVAPMWDDNKVTSSDPEGATRATHIINHTTLLLYHLVTSEDAAFNLRERLLHAPPKTYPGLIHDFILALGRLSYANPPYWLNEQDKARLMGVADLARALLEKVIQGPELDLIWEIYRDEGEDINEAAMNVDDEEVEARKIANS